MSNTPAPSTERSSPSTQTAPCTNASLIAAQARESRLRVSLLEPDVPESGDGGDTNRTRHAVVPPSGGTAFDRLLRKSGRLSITPFQSDDGTQHLAVSGPESVFADLFEQARGNAGGYTRH